VGGITHWSHALCLERFLSSLPHRRLLVLPRAQVAAVLNARDVDGSTPLHIAARFAFAVVGAGVMCFGP